MKTIRSFRVALSKLQAQINVILAISVYERNRNAAASPFGSWDPLVQPLQMLLFLLLIRLGLKAMLGGGGAMLAPQMGVISIDLFFNPVIFLVTGLSLVFLFRAVALKSINGLRLKAPLFYSRISPIDILLASALNDVRALASLSVAALFLGWAFTWSFRFDRPGLAISAYLLTVVMAVGFGVCVLFIGKFVPALKAIIKRFLQRIIIWTSGIFFATFEIPANVRPLITWNPILHGVEIFRYSINDSYPIPGISFRYLLICSLMCASFALILYRVNESMLIADNDD